MKLRLLRHVTTLRGSACPGQLEAASIADFCWRDGRSGLAFFAAGDAGATASLARPDTMASSRSVDVEQAADDDCAESGDALPMALHASDFDPTTPRRLDSPWHGWSRSRSWFPEHLLAMAANGRTFVVTQRLASSGRDIDLAAASARFVAKILASRPLPTCKAEPLRSASTAAERARYEALVVRASDAVRRGLLRKVVVARAEALESKQPFDPAAQFAELVKATPDAIAFAVRQGPLGTWLGATPEVLGRAVAGRFVSSAIAGTARKDRDPDGVGLLADAKIREEHGLVAEAMREALEPLLDQFESAPAPRALMSERLVHLETPMSGELGARSFLEVVRALHPTPALGGAPRDAALAWLREHEALDRGLFGGPLGWEAPNGDGVVAVGIRAALLRGTTATLFAGAGVVAESTPEEEWRETVAKLELARSTLRESLEVEEPRGARSPARSQDAKEAT